MDFSIEFYSSKYFSSKDIDSFLFQILVFSYKKNEKKLTSERISWNLYEILDIIFLDLSFQNQSSWPNTVLQSRFDRTLFKIHDSTIELTAQ